MLNIASSVSAVFNCGPRPASEPKRAGRGGRTSDRRMPFMFQLWSIVLYGKATNSWLTDARWLHVGQLHAMWLQTWTRIIHAPGVRSNVEMQSYSQSKSKIRAIGSAQRVAAIDLYISVIRMFYLYRWLQLIISGLSLLVVEKPLEDKNNVNHLCFSSVLALRGFFHCLHRLLAGM